MFQIENGRKQFYQWDINQRLIVNDDSIIEVHFSNAVSTLALSCEVFVENGIRLVNVPNILLQQAWTLKVYGCCADCVRAAEAFEIVSREKPSDYIYTEVDIKNYDELNNRITELEKNKPTNNRYELLHTIELDEETQEINIDTIDGNPIAFKKALVKVVCQPTSTTLTAKVAYKFPTMEEKIATISGATNNTYIRIWHVECKGADELYRMEWATASLNETSQRNVYTNEQYNISDEDITGIEIASTHSTVGFPAGTIIYVYAVKA